MKKSVEKLNTKLRIVDQTIVIYHFNKNKNNEKN
mgnify:CR=1 FL=1